VELVSIQTPSKTLRKHLQTTHETAANCIEKKISNAKTVHFCSSREHSIATILRIPKPRQKSALPGQPGIEWFTLIPLIYCDLFHD
jgi:hypothetical protein